MADSVDTAFLKNTFDDIASTIQTAGMNTTCNNTGSGRGANNTRIQNDFSQVALTCYDPSEGNKIAVSKRRLFSDNAAAAETEFASHSEDFVTYIASLRHPKHSVNVAAGNMLDTVQAFDNTGALITGNIPTKEAANVAPYNSASAVNLIGTDNNAGTGTTYPSKKYIGVTIPKGYFANNLDVTRNLQAYQSSVTNSSEQIIATAAAAVSSALEVSQTASGQIAVTTPQSGKAAAGIEFKAGYWPKNHTGYVNYKAYNPGVTEYDNADTSGGTNSVPTQRYTGITVKAGYHPNAQTYTRDLQAFDPAIDNVTISSGMKTLNVPKGYYSADKSVTITGPALKDAGGVTLTRASNSTQIYKNAAEGYYPADTSATTGLPALPSGYTNASSSQMLANYAAYNTSGQLVCGGIKEVSLHDNFFFGGRECISCIVTTNNTIVYIPTGIWMYRIFYNFSSFTTKYVCNTDDPLYTFRGNSSASGQSICIGKIPYTGCYILCGTGHALSGDWYLKPIRNGGVQETPSSKINSAYFSVLCLNRECNMYKVQDSTTGSTQTIGITGAYNGCNIAGGVNVFYCVTGNNAGGSTQTIEMKVYDVDYLI